MFLDQPGKVALKFSWETDRPKVTLWVLWSNRGFSLGLLGFTPTSKHCNSWFSISQVWWKENNSCLAEEMPGWVTWRNYSPLSFNHLPHFIYSSSLCHWSSISKASFRSIQDLKNWFHKGSAFLFKTGCVASIGWVCSQPYLLWAESQILGPILYCNIQAMIQESICTILGNLAS